LPLIPATDDQRRVLREALIKGGFSL